MGKLIHISRSQYRVLVSDVLPYERPLFFTNRFFARFLKYYGIVCMDGKLVAAKNHVEGLDEILAIIGGQPGDKRKAFQYTVSKDGEKEGRVLTIIHPFHQVQMVEFYNRYKIVLLDFCNRSHFSLRYPYKVATSQKRPKGFLCYLSDDVQKYHSEESIKHYFAYRHYHNINGFYDDYRFLRAEKKFAYMFKSDIEHCFDSIIPESLSIAMFDEEIKHCPGSMAEEFFLLNESYQNSKKGIVIGPEFSRLYAEIILQRVDCDTEKILNAGGLTHYKDYAFYRYVDDGFLFCNDKNVKDKFYEVYDSCLKQYGLKRKEENKENEKLDASKKHEYTHRPFLENITAGKLALIELIDCYFENRLETFKGYKKIQRGLYDTPTVLDYKTFIRSVRAIMGAYKLKYKDVMSYLLGCLHKRLGKLLRDFNDLYRQYSYAEKVNNISKEGEEIKMRYEREFSTFLENLIDVLFYLYQCDSRMNTSVKTVGIISQLQRFVRGKYRFEDGTWSPKFLPHVILSLDEKITDQTRRMFLDMPNDSTVLMEHLNMLELQKCMSRGSQLHPNSLINKFKGNENWTFFTIFELVHFIKNDERYQSLQEVLNEQISERINRLTCEGKSDTEGVLTFIEALCCPWFPMEVKREWLELLKIMDKDKVLSFAHKQKELFVRWSNYDVLEEVQHINNTEVY